MVMAIDRAASSPLTWLARATAVVCLFGAEAIHIDVIDEHINQWMPAGLFFVGLSLVEGMLAAALIVVPARLVRRLTVLISLATVAVWVVSRTVGIPLGPMAGKVEPVGLEDSISSALELITAAALVVPISAGRRREWRA